MHLKLYKLVDGKPVLMTWEESRFQTEFSTRVAKTTVGPATVSTVFVKLDLESNDNDPCCWETMVFGDSNVDLQDRCRGDQTNAMKMHERVVAQVRSILVDDIKALASDLDDLVNGG